MVPISPEKREELQRRQRNYSPLLSEEQCHVMDLVLDGIPSPSLTLSFPFFFHVRYVARFLEKSSISLTARTKTLFLQCALLFLFSGFSSLSFRNCS
jgi:hypothetical protein